MKRNVAFILVGVLLIALLGVVTGCSGGGTTTTVAATDTTVGSAVSPDTTGSGTLGGSDEGAKVFAATCAGCHGADGTGGIGPDLTVRTQLTKDRIIDQVTNGGTKMPPQGSKLSAEEISKVADYVLSDIVKH